VRQRRAKLVCTLGPATASAGAVRALAEAGTDVFRVNMSHGTAETHRSSVALVRAAGEALGEPLAVMADLPGPKIRLGDLAEEAVTLAPGSRFVLRAEGAPGDATAASTTYADLARDVRAADRILLADGSAELRVDRIDGADVVTEVIRGGSVRSHAGVNVSSERLRLPAITDRDRSALAAAIDLGVDLVAQSFVRSSDDVIELRSLMRGRPLPIVAKIETRPAVEAIASIARQAEAVMVARGDLGVELPLEEIPVVQKSLLREVGSAGRATIIATQMLESMLRAPRPTRAEASDVANAILDGTDAIMLSGETAIGEFPIEAARTASRLAEVAEMDGVDFRSRRPGCTHRDEAAAVAHAAAQIANDDPEIAAIACYTGTGRTASLLSAERPRVPIVAFVPNPPVRRALALRWGVVPVEARDPSSTDEMIALMDEGLRTHGLVDVGASVVMAASSPAGRTHTNLLKAHHVGSEVR
jgi:pyruvate kinase